MTGPFSFFPRDARANPLFGLRGEIIGNFVIEIGITLFPSPKLPSDH
jgi:hypothetical protein